MDRPIPDAIWVHWTAIVPELDRFFDALLTRHYEPLARGCAADLAGWHCEHSVTDTTFAAFARVDKLIAHV